MEKWLTLGSLIGIILLAIYSFGSPILWSSTGKSGNSLPDSMDSRDALRKSSLYKNIDTSKDVENITVQEGNDDTGFVFPAQDFVHYNYLPGYFNVDYRGFNNPEIDIQYCTKGNYQTSYWKPISLDNDEIDSFLRYDHLLETLKLKKGNSSRERLSNVTSRERLLNVIPFVSYNELNQTFCTEKGEIIPGAFSFNESGFHYLREYGGKDDKELFSVLQPIEYTQFTYESGKTFKVVEREDDGEKGKGKGNNIPDFRGIEENNCNYRIFDEKQVQLALAGRWIHLDGDSLSRDTFYDLIEIFEEEMILRAKSHDDQVYVKRLEFSDVNDTFQNSFLQTSLRNHDDNSTMLSSLFQDKGGAYRRNENIIPPDVVVISLGYNPSFKGWNEVTWRNETLLQEIKTKLQNISTLKTPNAEKQLEESKDSKDHFVEISVDGDVNSSQSNPEGNDWLQLKPDAWIFSPGLWFTPPTAENPFNSANYNLKLQTIKAAGESLGPETRTIYRSISPYPLRSYRSPINPEDTTFEQRSNLTWIQTQNYSRKRLNNYHEWMNGMAVSMLHSNANVESETSKMERNSKLRTENKDNKPIDKEEEKSNYYKWRAKHFPLNNWDVLDVWNMMIDRPELATDSIHFTGIGSKHITNIMLNMIINSLYLS